METDGQSGSAKSAAMLRSLIRKREKLQTELRNIETQVYELETSFLQDSSYFGNAWKGVEGSISSYKNTANLKRSTRKLQPEGRVFSLSSVTSPVAEELGAGHDDGRQDIGPGRLKGGGVTAANGQGKPKKGRTSSRDGKRTRPSTEPKCDDEDDAK